MIHVYVWDFKGKDIAWGHASMKVQDYYISWWPNTRDGAITKRIEFDYYAGQPIDNTESATRNTETFGIDIHRSIYSAHPMVNRTYEEDIAGERGEDPNHTISLKGLDEEKIINYWKGISIWADPELHGPPAHPWSTLGWNCSKVVAECLKKGGGDKYASWLKRKNMIWAPKDVKEYAASIKKGLGKEAYKKWLKKHQ